VLLASLLLGAGLNGTAGDASAAPDIAVSTTADVIDPGDGLTSLREAIALADVSGHDDRIVLGVAATYVLDLCDVNEGGGGLYLHQAQRVTIEGRGSTVDQTCTIGTTRLFGISSSGTSMVLRDLTFLNTLSGVAAAGGDVSYTPVVTLEHVVVRDASGACVFTGPDVALEVRWSRLDGCVGHGINSLDSDLTTLDLQDSEITRVSTDPEYGGYAIEGRTGNVARSSIHDNGGGAFLTGAVTFSASHFDRNSGKRALFLVRGGLTATDSTFDDNVVVDDSLQGRAHAGIVAGGHTTLTRISASRNVGAGAGVLVGSGREGFAPDLTITDSHVDDNVATGYPEQRQMAGISTADPGLVGPVSGSVSIIRTTVNGNVADDNSAVFSVVATTITDSTIAGNRVTTEGQEDWPGTVVVKHDLAMADSTVRDNVVRSWPLAASAGGILASHATLEADTIAGNTGDVGGVVTVDFGLLRHVTLTDNVGTLARHLGAPGDAQLVASVLSSAAGAAAPSCTRFGQTASWFASGGYNFVSDGSCPFTEVEPAPVGDITNGGDPGLGPLASNGGPTQTRMPVPASPLRNRIPSSVTALCAGTDQRGVTRPQGAGCDIGAVEAEPPGALFHALAPTRVLDSRLKPPGFNGPVVAGSPRSLVVTGASVPASASAVVVNVTVTGSSANSFLTVWPDGVAQPNASAINFAVGQTIPNLVTVKVGAGGRVAFATNQGSTDVVVDLLGYFDDGTGAGDGWSGIDPVRALDSRTPTGGWNAKLLAGVPRELTVRPSGGLAGVPAEASAVVANVTVTNGSANSFVTVWPAGQAKPTASSVNFAAGETTANAVIVAVGVNGRIAFANAVGATDVVVDIVGYFTPATGSRFFAVAPTRVLDDRVNVGAVGSWHPNETRAVTVTGGPIAATATGVAANVTVTNATPGSFVSVFPHATPKPAASTINFGPGQTIANQTMVCVTGGQVDIFNQLGSVDVIADVVGFFAT